MLACNRGGEILSPEKSSSETWTPAFVTSCHVLLENEHENLFETLDRHGPERQREVHKQQGFATKELQRQLSLTF